jgi:hypothetical protein
MVEDKRYHTDSPEEPPEHREVYHDKENCPEGKKILTKNRRTGTGGKKYCKVCPRY